MLGTCVINPQPQLKTKHIDTIEDGLYHHPRDLHGKCVTCAHDCWSVGDSQRQPEAQSNRTASVASFPNVTAWSNRGEQEHQDDIITTSRCFQLPGYKGLNRHVLLNNEQWSLLQRHPVFAPRRFALRILASSFRLQSSQNPASDPASSESRIRCLYGRLHQRRGDRHQQILVRVQSPKLRR